MINKLSKMVIDGKVIYIKEVPKCNTTSPSEKKIKVGNS